MKYKSFKIKNYKGISEVEIDLRKEKPICLVGLNESGKTTIMQAIYDFHNFINILSKNNNKLPNKDNQRIRPRKEFSGEIIIEASLSDVSEDAKTQIKNLLDGDELEEDASSEDSSENKEEDQCKLQNDAITIDDSISICISISYQNRDYQGYKIFLKTQDNNGVDISLKTKYLKEIIPEIIYYEDFYFEVPEKITISSEIMKKIKGSDAELTDDLKKQSIWIGVLDDILKSILSNEDSNFLKDVFLKYEPDQTTFNTRITGMEDVLNRKITDGWNSLWISEERLQNNQNRARMIDRISIDYEHKGNHLELSFRAKNKGSSFKISERSKGCIWFFSFLIFTEFRKNRSMAEKEILFLIDEPACNLHLSAQTKIKECIGDLITGSSVIYSTHSPHLIDQKWLRDTYIVLNQSFNKSDLEGSTLTKNEQSDITAVVYPDFENKMGQRFSSMKSYYFQPILDALAYKISNFELTQNHPLVIVEGVQDWYVLNYMKQKILKDNEPLSIFPAKGASTVPQFVNLCIAWSIPFVTLFDGDEAGEKEKKKLVENWGKFFKDKILSVKDILDKTKSIDQLISEEDQRKIIKNSSSNFSNNDKPSKDLLYQAIYATYGSEENIDISDETKETFLDLFKKIRKKLSLKKEASYLEE